MSRLATIVAAAAVAASVLTTAPAQGAPAPGTERGAAPAERRSDSCMTDEYRTKVRKVRGTEQIRLTRVKSTTYPGRTTITREQRIKVETDRVLKVALKYNGAGTLGASGMLKKVINIYGEISAKTEFKASFTSTRKESKYVSSQVKMTIPGGVSVAWFKGHRTVGGTFRYSWCQHYSGMPQQVGIVKWGTGRFSSYGYMASGGQRCDVKAYEAVAKAAKRAVCG